jgi:hypothetical protein
MTSNSSQNTALIRNQGGVPIGGIIGYEGSVSEFDGTGLGTGAVYGWAICNGQNTTGDMRGRNLTGQGTDAQFNNKFDTLGETGGVVERLIGVNNLPNFSVTGTTEDSGDHSHFVVSNDSATNNSQADVTSSDYIKKSLADSSTSQNYDLKGGATVAESGLTSPSEDHTHTFTSEPIGEGEEFDVLNPYYVAIWIKRIK